MLDLTDIRLREEAHQAGMEDAKAERPYNRGHWDEHGTMFGYAYQMGWQRVTAFRPPAAPPTPEPAPPSSR